jgi:branched-chain amino acid transport system ATP-binding protein
MTGLLEIHDLHAHYGATHVLQGVDLNVGRDQVVTLFGRNGVGKTTLIHAIMGFVPPTGGSVRFDGKNLAGRPPHIIARSGISLVPQGRRVFAPLTVEENLKLAQTRGRNGEWNLERVYELLPPLAERRRNKGNQLSGGEQQMLAIGRALLSNPRLVLLDEPSEGLAPKIVEDVHGVLRTLKDHGIPALLVEQNLGSALGLADFVYVMTKGRMAFSGTADDFRADPEISREHLGVG